jgi:type IV secretory pathway component VirB8
MRIKDFEKLGSQEEKLREIYKSVEKTRKYFLWTLILSLLFFVLPLIGLAIILPSAMGALTGGLI